MAQRRHHAERAFEKLLREAHAPYVAVNEARKALLPSRAKLLLAEDAAPPETLKNFDFIVYGDTANLLVEVKGRTIPAAKRLPTRDTLPRLECWVTLDDIEALRRWQRLFGPGYEAVFVFVYRCQGPPPDGLFAEIIEYAGSWYAVRSITLADYVTRMKLRSPKWRTVHLARNDFQRLSRPFSAPASDTPAGDHVPALELIGA